MKRREFVKLAGGTLALAACAARGDGGVRGDRFPEAARRRTLPMRGKVVRFVHIADSEIGGIGPRERRMFQAVKDVADRVDASFVIHTGDICFARGIRAHRQLMNDETLGRPMLYCLGNHDLTKEGPYGEWVFEQTCGPAWYSFDVGGIHFCVTPMKYGDGKPSYTAESIAEWLKADLAAIPKGRPVILFNHTFDCDTLFDMSDIRKGVVRLGSFDVTAACNLRGLIFGHLHTNHVRRFGKIAVIQTAPPQMGGVDLSPASIRVIDVSVEGDISSHLHYQPRDTWPVVTTAAEDGWVTRLPGPVYMGAPVTDGERIFVGTLDDNGAGTGAVCAIDAKAGQCVWQAKAGNSITHQVVAWQGRVFAQDADGVVYAFEGASGKCVWRYDPETLTRRPHQFGLEIDAAHGRLFCEIGERMTAIDAATGRVAWVANEQKLYASTASRPVCREGIVTGESQWHGLYAFDAVTGKPLWKRDRTLDFDELLRWRSGTVAIDGGKIYATAHRAFFIVDAKTGKTLKRHTYPFSLMTTATPLVTQDRIYLGSCNAGLVVLNRETLDVVWQGKVGEALVVNGSYEQHPQQQVASSPVLADAQTICAACGDGTIRFWDKTDGLEVRCVSTGAPHFAAPLVAFGRVFAADFAGVLRCFGMIKKG